jgi:hypothetical protein
MSSNLSSDDQRAILKRLQEQQEAGASEQIRRDVMELALALSLPPEGLSGHVDMALKVDRRKLVIKALRDAAHALEQGQ